MAKTIRLSRRLVAIVDDRDYAWLNQWRWSADKKPHTSYAVRKVQTPKGKRLQQMDRLILGLEFGDVRVAAHRNGIGLDNQRANLFVASRQVARWNTKRLRGKSRFIGVSFEKSRPRGGKFRAQIWTSGKRRHLGYFHSAREAALAYDRAVQQERAEFAVTNHSLGLL